ncbi:MAG: hypothetical protein R2836_09155 [Chitinophagales bacterium]
MSENKTHNSSKEFKDYFSGNMTNEDKLSFENEANQNEFEKEAMEGFQSLENNAEALELIKDIETQIERKTGIKRGKTINFPIWKSLSIAASLLIVVGVGVLLSQFLKNDNSSNLADNKAKTVEAESEPVFIEEPAPITDSLVENELLSIDDEIVAPAIPATTENYKLEEKKPIPPKVEVPTNTLDNESLQQNSKKEVQQSAPQETDNVAIGNNNSVDMLQESGTTSRNVVNMVQNDIEEKEVIETAEVNSSYDTASELYKEGQFSSAKNYFKKSISEGKHVAASSYYEAMCEYQLGNNKSAKNKFDQIINSQNSFSNISKWYKADILLKENKPNEAKTLLQDLANGNSSFKKQAEEKLKTLK